MKKSFIVLLLLLSACKNLETSIEEIAPPSKSKKADGYIFFEYLNYDKNLTVFDGENTRFILRTKSEDVQNVEFIMDGKNHLMESIGKMGEFEYFEAKVKKIKNGNFYFRVMDGELVYFFGEKSSLKEKEVTGFQYIVEENKITEIDSKLWYRVYIDSFYNGDKENDPIFNEYGPESFVNSSEIFKNGIAKETIIDGWNSSESKKILGQFNVSQWNEDFNNPKNWENKAKTIYNDNFYSKRFGGDLKGIESKIPYFKEFGVEVLWLSSPFYSFSGNKNDVIDYRHISPDFGLMLNDKGISEYKQLRFTESDKNDLGETLESNSWKNSESDEIFIELIKKLKNEGMNTVVDINFDYVSQRFFAFEDILKKGKKSPYLDWFNIEISEETTAYSGLSDLGVESSDGIRYRKSFVEILNNYSAEEKQELLNWNKTHMIFDSLGLESNLIKLNLKNENVKKYLTEISKKWLESGLAGYVVRARENHEFYEEWEKRINPDEKYIVKYDFVSNKTLDKNLQLNYELPYVLGNFLGNNKNSFTGEDLYTNLYILNRDKNALNFIEGIDMDRLNSGFINGNREFDSENEEKDGYLGINPLMIDENNLKKYKMAIVIQFLLSGNQSIYYGSEKFMWGGDVPHNRKPMLWDEYFPFMDESDNMKKYEEKRTVLDTKIVFDGVEGRVKYKIPLEKTMEEFYKKLIKVKNENEKILNDGIMDKIKTNENLLIFSKSIENQSLIFLINKGSKDEKMIVEVGKGKELTELFSGDKKDILKTKAEITVPPYSFLIYKKK